MLKNVYNKKQLVEKHCCRVHHEVLVVHLTKNAFFNLKAI